VTQAQAAYNALKMCNHLREATAEDSNSPKVHRREGYLATVHIKPVMFFPLYNCRVDLLLLR
jgi:hypothetical protein